MVATVERSLVDRIVNGGSNSPPAGHGHAYVHLTSFGDKAATSVASDGDRAVDQGASRH
jgi:hypothetical protein